MLVALAGLVLILDDVLLLQLTHALDLIQVHNEAFLVTMQWFDTLTAENVQMVGAVEMLDALWMLLTELFSEAVLVLILEIKAGASQDGILLDDLVQDVDVEWQSLSALELLDELTADWASHTILVMELLDAVGAKGVPAVHQDARDALAHIVLHRAELANVQAARLVIEVHQSGAHYVYFALFRSSYDNQSMS